MPEDCCQTDSALPRKYRCPVNGKEYTAVHVKTVLHHLASPWNRTLNSERYYFCSDTDCDVVYFGQDDSIISKSELRTAVGIKEKTPERMLCYCFDVSYVDAQNNRDVVKFVRDKTRQALCTCETSNPSGRCCLKDFPKQ
ncbi:MAG: hypothetical protein P8Z75_15640 [Gammaproteobacteria bacterium]|jgi:CMP-2-keto-3-deoxyoctulosonic acid synthetase